MESREIRKIEPQDNHKLLRPCRAGAESQIAAGEKG